MESQRSYLLPLLALLALTTAVYFVARSCRSSNRPRTVKITGRVTVNQQLPPGRGTIYFSPLESAPGFPKRPALAEFDEQGQYSVTTFEPGDGLLPGRYALVIHCWKVQPTVGGPPPVSFLHARYQTQSTSGFELVVDGANWSQKFDIDLEGATSEPLSE